MSRRRIMVLSLLLAGLSAGLLAWMANPEADGPVEQMQDVQPAPQATAGPLLRGGADTPAPMPVSEAAPIPATRDDDEVHVAEGTTWKELRTALYEARKALLRREQDLRWEASQAARRAQGLPPLSTRRVLSIAPSAAAHLEIPGVPGLVHVNGRPPSGPGLALYLVPAKGEIEARIKRRNGVAWIRKFGCDTSLSSTKTSNALTEWMEELVLLAQVSAPARGFVQVEADPRLPSDSVIPFLSAAAEAGIEEVIVPVAFRRRFDDAVDDSSRWLAAHQLPDGGWNEAEALRWCDGKPMEEAGSPNPGAESPSAGLTGLCLLAYLDAGYTNRGKHGYARVVSRGMRRLKNQQHESGNFAPAGTPRDHLWATLAMVKIFGMTGSPIFKGPAQRGLGYLPAAWRKSSKDLLATALGAAVMSTAREINADLLRRGKPLALTLPDEIGNTLLEHARLLFRHPEPAERTVGTLARLLLGDDPDIDSEIDPAVVASVEHAMSDSARQDPCLIWLTTQLVFRGGTHKLWKRWDAHLGKHVAPLQRHDGHHCCVYGSFDPPAEQVWMPGRVATTALLGRVLGARWLPYSHNWRK